MFCSRFAVAFFAAATLGACDVVGDDDSSSALGDPAVQSCLRDTIEECNALSHTPEQCAAYIQYRCLGITNPGDPGGPGNPGDPPCTDPPPGPDPMCVEAERQECLAQGVDPMTCDAYANQVCDPANGGQMP